MSDSGLGGALLLSQQLEWYRMADTRARTRGRQALEGEYAVLHQRFVELAQGAEGLLGLHYQLVADCSKLRTRMRDLAADHDRQVEAVAQLRNEKVEWQAEREDLRDQLAQARLSAKLRGNIVKQYDPDFYTSD